ncbi:MAG: NAD(P)-dependent oxidoreductase [Rhizobiales bacterium]|nr:NAD(P)-dependent oxidoreductase [Rhizobacter sp.]
MSLGCVLLTGAGGRVARHVRPHLAGLCRELRLSDRVPITAEHPNESIHLADLGNAAALPALLQGAEAIVHFAGYPREADWATLFEANIRAVAQLWEAAVAHGVKRIVYASSNHAAGYNPRSRVVDGQAPPRPDSRYGVTKVFMEALASLHADKHGLRAMGLRIGHCAPAPSDARMLSTWVHPADLAALIEVGLTADYHHEVVFGVSANSASWWDNRRAEALGYRPRHSADAFAAALAGVRSESDVAERYQGGSFAADGHRGDPERPARAA